MSTTYKTQMDAAKQGIITPQMKLVAKKEKIHPELLCHRVAKGTVCIPANRNHVTLNPEGIGEGLRTKINVNLGISRDSSDMGKELDKVKTAISMKADAIMDLSNYGKTREMRKKILELSTAMLGTVPVYDTIGYCEKKLKDITKDDFLRVVKQHAEDGVDFMTIHAGINRATAKKLKENPRRMNLVSRGGALLFAWMEMTGNENPFFEYYDEVLEIFREYDVTISLGDACRPGCLDDSTDPSQISELIVLGELTKRAWANNVQVMVEGPGHMALNEIPANMMVQKRLCYGAPFYVLGPLVTDVAPGYDHITSAIGGAIAAANGADFLCYVTPAEHLCLPDLEDMKEGIIASRIAAHAADIAKGIPGAMEWDNAMAEARRELDWDAMFELALDPQKPKNYRSGSKPKEENTCTMCGEQCAVRNMNRILSGEEISI